MPIIPAVPPRIYEEKVIILTSTGANTWTVPTDWNTPNSIECIGAGQAGGRGYNFPSQRGNGGAGGDWAIKRDVSLTPSASVPYSIGAQSVYSGTSKTATAAADTWFGHATFGSATVGAAGGGSTSVSIGDETSTGGPGGVGRTYGAGGGGGAGGADGVGGAGGGGFNGGGVYAAGGGGGSSGGTNGDFGGGGGLGGDNVDGVGGSNGGGQAWHVRRRWLRRYLRDSLPERIGWGHLPKRDGYI